ncbi:SLBB domain-containing protein [Rheinheimera sp. MMS21-TC3]|uniref:SLBB domain-containing protein n=1 Tax=Rheinheimera sp. MMS21-TC3 TaxID=3072790 RepID=UPI0028C44659|nr:SLBB domain-containing protein [Rheinheimera sp. MMS21-TC3]WNO61683.1 SLBB domain-containing protein [Rheinheimera sp. MMS21-TC3]
MFKIAIRTLLVAALSLWSAVVAAQAVTPAMLEQFKQLPRAQQEQLAQQYGINLSDLGLTGASSSDSENPDDELLQRQKQRKQQEEKDKKTADTELKRFGMNMFEPASSSFSSAKNLPVPDEYILGPGDNLQLQLFGKVNRDVNAKVNRDGAINIADMGALQVSGLRYAEAKDLIIERVKQQLLGTNVAVSMGALRTINVIIAGEAKYPGSYNLPALSSVTQALFAAGGVSEIGSLRHISVQRSAKSVARFDLYDLLLKGNATNNVFLKDGDVVFVAPVTAIAEVSGEVHRPAKYEVSATDTLQDLLAMAGGATPKAYPQKAVLERFNKHNYREYLSVDLTNPKQQKLQVRAGDALKIGATSPQVQNAVTLVGAVVRPGVHAWQPGLKLTDLLGSRWSDLHRTADLNYGIILREINPLGDIDILQFRLADAINQPNSADNIELKARDTVVVFHQALQTFQRSALNKYLRDKLEQRFDIAIELRWLNQLDIAEDGFRLMSEPEVLTEERLMADIKKLQSAEGRLFADDITKQEQEKALKESFAYLLDNVLDDAELIKFTPHLTRTELLYPVLQKLRQQARNGVEAKIVSVNGEVLVEGDYPQPIGGTVLDLIDAAGGLKDSAFLKRAELTRAVANSGSARGVYIEHESVDLSQVLSGQHNIALASRDRLNVFAVPEWDLDKTITLHGEVKFPGVYTIQQGEKLSDVIKRAGGLTNNAFVDGSLFTREQIREREAQQLKKLSEQLRADIAAKSLSSEIARISPEDSITMINEIEKVKPIGRLVIDLPMIIAGEPSADLQVEDGDELFIPRENNTISIVGEVQHPSSHRFANNQILEDYLKLAGGFRIRADKDRVYVIRANGSVMVPESSWFSASQNNLKAGDTIVVPLDTEYKDNLNLWAQVTQIFYQTAVAIAALNSF